MRKILVVNDNHFLKKNNAYVFTGSKFHLFLKGFTKSIVNLSSPTENNIINIESCICINNVNVLPRLGYGLVINFYIKLPINFFKHYKLLYNHIVQHDIVLLVAPASTLPISYFICKLLKKTIAIYIVGDVVEVVRQDNNSATHIKWLKFIVAKIEWKITKNIAKNNMSFTLGSSLYNKLKPFACDVNPAMTSLIRRDKVVLPENVDYNTPIKLLSVSRLSNEKGIDLALKAVASLIKKYSIKYTIIGDGPEMVNLQQLVSVLNIKKNIIFTGYLEQAEIRQYYLTSDIFLMPSRSEGIPKVILDAMASAISIIATNVGGIPDLLSKDESRGWLIEPGNKVQLESSIIECIENKSQRYEKLLEANKYIKKHTLEMESGNVESKLLNLHIKNEL